MQQLDIRTLANDFMLDHGIGNLPLKFEDLKHICKKISYHLVTYANAFQISKKLDVPNLYECMQKNAFTYRGEKHKIIFYRDDLPNGKQLKVIAHELGHIYLRHSDVSGILGLSVDPETTKRQEAEAEAFAYQVLAPPIVLKKLKVCNTNQIQKITLLEYDDAMQAKECMRLYPFAGIDNDFKIIEQFGDYIDERLQIQIEAEKLKKKLEAESNKPPPKPKGEEWFYAAIWFFSIGIGWGSCNAVVIEDRLKLEM